MSDAWVNIAATLHPTRTEGPGARFAIWLQGCCRRCPGCCNPEFQPFLAARVIPAEVLANEVLAAASDVEGITLLGGEPFLQARSLAAVARRVRVAGLSVVTFTGYRIEELAAPGAPDGSLALPEATDLLVDGPFVRDLPESARLWVGSSNQRFHFLTNRYAPGVEAGAMQSVEVRIGGGGAVTLNGWPVDLEASDQASP